MLFILRKECHLPQPDAPVRASAGQLPRLCTILKPQHSIGPTNLSIQDSNFLHWLRYTPDVDMRIERCRGAVYGVRCPGDAVDACGVACPAGGDRLREW